MGFKVEYSASDSGSSKALLEEGAYTATLYKFESGTSANKGTPFIRPMFNNVQDAYDTDGNEWSPKMNAFVSRDDYTFWITPGSMWRLKRFASELGVELPEDDTEYDSLEEFAAEMLEAFEGDYTIIVEHVPAYNDPNKHYANVVNVS